MNRVPDLSKTKICECKKNVQGQATWEKRRNTVQTSKDDANKANPQLH